MRIKEIKGREESMSAGEEKKHSSGISEMDAIGGTVVLEIKIL